MRTSSQGNKKVNDDSLGKTHALEGCCQGLNQDDMTDRIQMEKRREATEEVRGKKNK